MAERCYPSSKTCSNCSSKRETSPLSLRNWTCPECYSIHGRDINAAINLRNLAVSPNSRIVNTLSRQRLNMKSHRSLIDEQDEIRELTEKDFAVMQLAKEVLPTFLLRKISIRGSQKSPTKTKITIRLSPEVVKQFRATGKH